MELLEQLTEVRVHVNAKESFTGHITATLIRMNNVEYEVSYWNAGIINRIWMLRSEFILIKDDLVIAPYPPEDTTTHFP